LKLGEGLEQEVHFKLEEPIICGDTSLDCQVVVNISNTHPEWVSVNPCLLIWNTDDWFQTKSVTVRTVQDYVHENEDRTVLLRTEVTGVVPGQKAVPDLYISYDPEDIVIASKKQGSAQCRATGDPHYTTFDGKYWHFYDGNRRQPTRLTYYKSTKRDFVMQVQVRGNPAVACAIAGREGDDRVMINNCGGGVSVQASYKTIKVEDQPRIDVSGNTYTVYFKSGAWIRASVSSWGMNVYTQSVDPGASCGACGNFDGNANNDAVGYTVYDYGILYPCQKVCTAALNDGCTCKNGANSGEEMSCDIWEYTPQNTNEATETVPVNPAKEFCEYNPSYVKPLIGAQDVEDLTDFLKKHTEEEEDRGVFVFDIDNEDLENEVVKQDEVVSEQQCSDAMHGDDPAANEGANSQLKDMIDGCKSMDDEGGKAFNEKFAEVLEDCTMDLSELGGKGTDDGAAELVDAVQILEQSCIELFIRFGHRDCVDDKCMKLRNALCPEQCNGADHGTCADAACVCKDEWAGKACSIKRTEAPTVTAISDYLCDTHSNKCPSELEVSGTGFFCDKGCNDAKNELGPKCVYETDEHDDIVVEGQFSGEDLVVCPVPRGSETLGRHRGATQLKATVRVSNGGEFYSEQEEVLTFYDSQCTLCSEEAGVLSCSPNPETCQIEICTDAGGNSVPCADGQTGKVQCFRNGIRDPRLHARLGDVTNPCLSCVPKKSTTSFSYNFNNDECQPKFDKGHQGMGLYDAIIKGKLAEGEVKGETVYIDNKADQSLIIDGGDNAYVNDAPGYAVTYSINIPDGMTSAEGTKIEEMFSVDETSGQISIDKSVDIDEDCNGMTHCIADPTKFNGFFMVEACHNDNACATASVLIEVEATNDDSNLNVFDSMLYTATITENPEAGAKVVVLDPEGKELTAKNGVTYSLWNSGTNIEAGTWTVGESTAKITVAKPKNVDYEKIDLKHCGRTAFDSESACTDGIMDNYCVWDGDKNKCIMLPTTLILKATDSEGGHHYADVELTVLNVEEAPTAVVLSESELKENTPAGTIVGTLLCEDPEHEQDTFDGCTFALDASSAADFDIFKNNSGSYLTVSKEFNYEQMVKDTADGNQIAVKISATDPTGATSEFLDVSVTIIDINEKPINMVLAPANGLNVIQNAMTLPEDLAPGTLIGMVSAEDPDSGYTDEPACQLVQGSEYFTISSNTLTLTTKLDFEEAPVVKVGFACIDRPAPGFTPLVSDVVTYEIKVTDRNDAPEGLILTQDGAIPDEHQPATGEFKIGKLRAADKDATAVAFTMQVAPGFTDTWDIRDMVCDAVGGVMTCSADLYLIRPLSAGDGSCAPPNANGNVFCEAKVQLTDGTDSTISALTTIDPPIRLTDVMDEPIGIKVDTEFVESGWENGHRFGTVSVDDIDGFEGPMGRPGHTVTLKSTPRGVFGLVPKSRGRRDGTTREWEFKVENARAINPNIDSLIELEFTVIDQKMPGKSFTFSKELAVVSDGDSAAGGGGVTQEAGDVAVDSNILIVPFMYSNDAALETTLSLTGEDIPTQADKFDIVRLQAPDGGNCVEKWVTKAGSNFLSAVQNQGDKMCEDDGGDDSFKIASLDGADGSTAVVSVRPTADTVPAGYSRSNGELYLKIAKDTATTVYLKLTVQFQGSCAVTSGENTKCAANEACYVCDLTDENVDVDSRPYEFTTCAAADRLTLFSFKCLDVVAEAEEKLAHIEEEMTKTDAEIAAAEKALADAGCTLGSISGVCAPLIEEIEDLNAIKASQEAAKARQSHLKNGGDEAGAELAFAAKKAEGRLEQAQVEVEKAELQLADCVATQGVDAPACRALEEEKESFENDAKQLLVEFQTASSALDDTTNDGAIPSESGSNTGTIIGVVVAILFIIIVAVLVMLYLNNEKRKKELEEKAQTYGQVRNANYSDPQQLEETRFLAGQKNPLFDWYHPDMDRQGTQDHLANAPEGGFVVRDSKSSPGWFMLDVKTGGTFAHDKIRNSDDDMYELIVVDTQQPKFNTLPELVEHYTSSQPGMPYTLQLANSVQDQLQADSMSNPMYFAGAQQPSGGAATYDDIDANPPPGGYMDVSA
jgi:hypothetical protein